MNFKRIQHFVHIAELGSVTKAAERLNVVQPALTRSIKLLEEELSTALFTRSRRGMELTPSGQVFLKHAYGILSQYHRAKESLLTAGDAPKGRVSIAMTESVSQVLTVPVCQQLTDLYPDIVLNLEAGLIGNVHLGFEGGRYDLVLSYSVRPDMSLHVEELLEEDLYLVSPYAKTGIGADFEFDDLDGMNLIIPPDQHGLGTALANNARTRKINVLASQIRGGLQPALQLIEAGFGCSLMPWSAIYDRIKEKRLLARKIVNPNLQRTISMIYPTHRPLTPATIAVMQLIRQSVVQANSEGRLPGRLILEPTQSMSSPTN